MRWWWAVRSRWNVICAVGTWRRWNVRCQVTDLCPESWDRRSFLDCTRSSKVQWWNCLCVCSSKSSSGNRSVSYHWRKGTGYLFGVRFWMPVLDGRVTELTLALVLAESEEEEDWVASTTSMVSSVISSDMIWDSSSMGSGESWRAYYWSISPIDISKYPGYETFKADSAVLIFIIKWRSTWTFFSRCSL